MLLHIYANRTLSVIRGISSGLAIVSAIVTIFASLCSCDPSDKNEPAVPVIEGEDLSASGTANCYIAEPSSKVSFDATVKGNSTTEKIAGAVSASLVWQDAVALVKEVKYDKVLGRINVSIGDGRGNAVVSVNDASGKVLWSWHLWICKYNPQESLYQTKADESGVSWLFMDRNIGAKSINRSEIESHGLIYQWGRKDPFPGANSFTVQNVDYSYQEDGETTLYDISGKPLPKIRELAAFHGSLQASIENPMKFYAVAFKDTVDADGNPVQESDYPSRDWTDVSNDDFWGGVSGSKTIYDPCPVGYKVPVFVGESSPYAWMVFAEMQWDKTNSGALQDGQWFPAGGTRVYASGGLDYPEANPYAGIWTGTAVKPGTTSQVVYGQYMFIINNRRMYKVINDVRSQGMNVRCVRE